MKIDLNYEKIFIAGSNGMVGSAIKRFLKHKLKSADQNVLTPSRQELDLTNIEEVKLWFKKNKPTVVILAAAKVGGIYANNNCPADFLIENLKIQTNVIHTAYLFGVRRLLFLGSSCIYPKFSKQPIKEEYLLSGHLEETNEAYAIAKIAGIKLCESLRFQFGFDAIALMPTNLYGPNDNYDLLNSHVMAAMIRRFREATKVNRNIVSCWGSGSPLREFLHVDDLADAVFFCLENWFPNQKNAPADSKGKPLIYLNVGTGKDISIKELALKIAELTEFKGKILWDKTKPDGTPKKQLDITAISSLGWKPKITLDEGIRKTILNVNF